MIRYDQIDGAVLAGGKSSRMGSDKALLEFRGKPFIQRAVESMQQVFDRVAVISPYRREYDFLDVPIVPDLVSDCGPLGGIFTALESAKSDRVFVAPCDSPMLSAELIRRILVRAGGRSAVASIGGRTQPLIGQFKKKDLLVLKDLLARGMYRVHIFAETIQAEIIDVSPLFPPWKLNPLANVNTPQDYSLLQQTYSG